jgi:hypothetical protein
LLNFLGSDERPAVWDFVYPPRAGQHPPLLEFRDGWHAQIRRYIRSGLPELLKPRGR